MSILASTHALRARPVLTTLGVALSACALAIGASAAAAVADGNSENAKLCQQGGFEAFVTSTGQGFANQGECVSYAAQGGTLSASPTLRERWEAICRDAGGQADTNDVSWACHPQGVSMFSEAVYNEMASICTEAGGTTEPAAYSPNPIFIHCNFF